MEIVQTVSAFYGSDRKGRPYVQVLVEVSAVDGTKLCGKACAISAADIADAKRMAHAIGADVVQPIH
ncbi:hypothetical protein [Pandoraea sputorum]